MSEEFQVGDVVVCVDADTPARPGYFSPDQIRNGDLYRLSDTFIDEWGDCIKVAGIVAHTVNGGFLAARFRKLPRADEEFTRQIRACKPQRTPAHSGAPQ